MAKKRKANVDEGNGRKKSPNIARNPFLAAVRQDTKVDHYDYIFQHVIAFQDLSQQHHSIGDTSETLDETLRWLLDFIETFSPEEDVNNTAEESTLASPSRIASTLLPWVTQKLLGDASVSRVTLLHRALASCLYVLMPASSEDLQTDERTSHNHLVLLKILPSSVVIKLVPKILNSALNFDTLNANGTSMYAASCYKLLTRHLYSPVFEIACKTLLMPVTEKAMNTGNNSQQEVIACVDAIALATLELLKRTSQKANQRTLFQILSTGPILLALGGLNSFFQKGRPHDSDGVAQQCQILLRSILWDGLFDPGHHLDGFRSVIQIMGIPDLTTLDGPTIATPMEHQDESQRVSNNDHSTFQCYQEGLFSVIRDVLSAPSLESEDHERKHENIRLVQMIPLLLEGFFRNLSEFEHCNRNKRTKTPGKTDPSQLQFAFFATLSTLLWRVTLCCQGSTGKKAIRLASLFSLSQCLSLLLQYDVYVPSSGQKQLERTKYLHDYASYALGALLTSSEEWRHTLNIVEKLVRLDHMLIHNKLDAVLLFCVGKTFNLTAERPEEGEPVSLACTVIRTYQQLRELNLLVTAFLAVAKTFWTEGDADSLTKLGHLLEHPSVAAALSDAVASAPIEKVKGMFNKTEAWIVHESTEGLTTEASFLSMSIVVKDIMVVLVKNVRVDKSTASDIAMLCLSVVQGAVRSLCDEANPAFCEGASMVGLGLALFGCIIDLQMRCAFWLGHHYTRQNKIDSCMPRKVRLALTAVVESGSSDVRQKGTELNEIHQFPVDELLLLASYRLQQVDYLSHEPHLNDADDLSDTSAYSGEAQRLAAFMLRVATTPEMTRQGPSRWKRIAQVITFWTTYSDDEQVSVFLRWMFTAMADTEQKNGSFATVYPGGRQVSLSILSEERLTALSLLHDASFLEMKKVARLVVPCALSVAADLIQAALNLCLNEQQGNDATKWQSDAERLLCRVTSCTWRRASPEQFSATWKYTKISNASAALQIEPPAMAIRMLEGGRRIISIVNGLPLLPFSSKWSLDCADLASRLECFCRRFFGTNIELSALALRLIAALRLATSRSLSLGESGSLGCILGDKDLAVEIISNIQQSTVRVLQDVDGLRGANIVNLLDSTGKLVAVISAHCFNNAQSQDPFLSFLRQNYCSHGTAAQQVSNALVLASTGRSYVSVLFDIEKHDVRSVRSSEAFRLAFQSLCTWITVTVSNYFDELLVCSKMMLAGDLFLLYSKACHNGRYSEEKSLINKIADEQVAVWEKNLMDSASIRNGGLYMIARFSLTAPSIETRQLLVDKLLSGTLGGELLEASICSLTSDMVGDELHSVLEKVRDKVKDGSTSGLKLYRLLLQVLKSEEQIPVVSDFAPGMLQRALDVFQLRRTQKDWGSAVVIATSLIIEMIQDKRIIALKERQVALIIAQLSSLMEGRTTDETPLLPYDIYGACFSLFSTLIQRFPKQLYTCVPSVISLLHLVQLHAIYGELSELEIRGRSQKFTRLCELLLPHKDVYKKHILCLLLEFIHGLASDMSVLRKQCLLPSVYYLLDMLSKYELQQLNVAMHTTEKSLFRSIHQSYQKMHMFKGQ